MMSLVLALFVKSVAMDLRLSQYATLAEYSPFFRMPPMNYSHWPLVVSTLWPPGLGADGVTTTCSVAE